MGKSAAFIEKAVVDSATTNFIIIVRAYHLIGRDFIKYSPL